MDRELFDSTIQEYKRRVPFKPFTISLLNGDRLQIDFPDAIFVRDGAGFFIGPGRVLAVFDNDGVVQVVDELFGNSPS